MILFAVLLLYTICFIIVLIIISHARGPRKPRKPTTNVPTSPITITSTHSRPTGYVRDEGYTDGILHCVNCDIAGHYHTFGGFGPCYKCGDEMRQRVARWNKELMRWEFIDE